MTTDTEELRRLAEAATPGPWTWWTSCSFRRLSSDASGKDGDVLHAVKYKDGVCGIEGSESDMAFIAAANPAAVLELLDTLAAQKAENAALRKEVEALRAQTRWVPVTEKLPESGRNVLFCWENEIGKSRVSMGYYAAKHTHESEYEPDEWADTYCDIEDGTYYMKEGWYENPWELDQCAMVAGVTRWQPLPSAPTKETGQ